MLFYNVNSSNFAGEEMKEKIGTNNSESNLTVLNKAVDLKFLLRTLDQINTCICITDLSNNILYANKSFCDLYQHNLEEMSGKNIKLFTPSPSKNMPILINEEVHYMKVKGKEQNINTKKDEAQFNGEIEASYIKDEQGKPIAIVRESENIFKKIKEEKHVKQDYDKYRNLFTELKDAIYESTPQGKLIELNPSGYELLGIEPGYPLDQIDIAEELYVHKEDRDRFKQKLERDGYVKNYEIDIRKKNGEIITVLETAMVVRNEKGKITSYRGILRDITEAKKSEKQLKDLVNKLAVVNEQLQESENELKNLNASKDRFFSIIAHDLRSPFSSILSFSEFLVEDINELTKEELISFAGKINEAAKNVFVLLENLLQWSRIQSGKIQYEPINFNMFHKTNEVIYLLQNNANNKDITIENEITNDSIVFADEDMVFSVLQNLISNAIKFTKPGGVIKINSIVKEKTVEFSVRDNGVGIKEEDIHKLFRLDINHSTYGTKEEKGSGLGLILCKEMIEKNKGKIWVKSKVNAGTTFTFSLPRS